MFFIADLTLPPALCPHINGSNVLKSDDKLSRKTTFQRYDPRKIPKKCRSRLLMVRTVHKMVAAHRNSVKKSNALRLSASQLRSNPLRSLTTAFNKQYCSSAVSLPHLSHDLSLPLAVRVGWCSLRITSLPTCLD